MSGFYFVPHGEKQVFEGAREQETVSIEGLLVIILYGRSDSGHVFIKYRE